MNLTITRMLLRSCKASCQDEDQGRTKDSHSANENIKRPHL